MVNKSDIEKFREKCRMSAETRRNLAPGATTLLRARAKRARMNPGIILFVSPGLWARKDVRGRQLITMS